MLGCIVAGRQVQTNLQTVSPGKFLFVLSEPSTINHIVIFLTGEALFAEGTGASIYCNSDIGTLRGIEWRFLGVLTNDKPSAVFKVSGLPLANALEIGISVEPISVLEQLLMEGAGRSQSLVPVSPSPSSNPVTIAQRVGENLFNFVTSFARCANELEPFTQVVPLKTVQEWFNNLVRKATTDSDGFMRQITRSD